MKRSKTLKRKVRTAVPYLLALLLAIALLPGAALANPPGPLPPDNNNNNQNQNNPAPPSSTPAPPASTPAPPGGNTQNAPAPPPPGSGNNGGSNTPNNPPPPPASNNGQDDSNTPVAHPDAPDFPSADCIVTHAATPAQLCPISGGLQYYFIGADGSPQTGPYIKPFSELATLHTVGTSVRLYTGSNPFTGKSVHIDYLPADTKLRISTYYPDTMYDTDKPYTFTVDSGNSVTHEAW
ncbi:MAG: hypothetical protein OXJ55_06055 [Caldilineaceae bacterium]|nr:hypothetical protein [Caldilineaceae bacterium]